MSAPESNFMRNLTSMSSLENQIGLYKENLTMLENQNTKLVKENHELHNLLQEKSLQMQILQEKLTIYELTSKSPQSLSQKSNLLDIIENYQQKTTSKSKFDDLEFEFDDIEKIKNRIKGENNTLKRSLAKFEDLYPSMNKISNLIQRLYLAIQSFIRGDPLNIVFLISSPEKKYKTVGIIEHFAEDINKTKEILEKIIKSLTDYYAEKYGNENCCVF
ncbi:hypothetical protein SteCoe_8428 [Stentor coeruleus]|uniref:Uncharacterized protein n=1 Tax=Stentor coeruleus TaxID=5963 RepID=A0A1R2CK68_9CILI|nr:hypothetical protein SteCoe_8428 [Stentor coeruleus]